MKVLTHIIEMLEDLGHKLHILDLYLPVGFLPEHNESIENAVVEVFVDIIMFWSKTVATLSKNPLGEIDHSTRISLSDSRQSWLCRKSGIRASQKT